MSKKYILITSLILFCNLIFSQKIKHNSNNVDLIPYRIGHKWGFSNSNGELKMPTIYSEVKFFNKYGLAHVATGGPNRTDLSFGYIDTLGNEVVPIKQYEYLHDFVDSLARADLKNKKYCVFDLQGDKVLYTKYKASYSVNNPMLNNTKQEFEREFYINAEKTKVVKATE